MKLLHVCQCQKQVTKCATCSAEWINLEFIGPDGRKFYAKQPEVVSVSCWFDFFSEEYCKGRIGYPQVRLHLLLHPNRIILRTDTVITFGNGSVIIVTIIKARGG